jgi:hypothetical protein
VSVNDDLRTAIRHAGLHCKPVTLLLCESDVHSSQDVLLQQLNSLICTGDVPGLFTKDEMTVMASELVHVAAKQVSDVTSSMSLEPHHIRKHLRYAFALAIRFTIGDTGHL